MTSQIVCPQCSNTVLGGAGFCPSCGSAISPHLAGSFERFCAASVDIAIWLSLSALLIWLGWKWWLSLVIWVGLTELGYQLNGLGKSLIGLSVPVKTRRQHYLRETIGKLASLAIFGIGYLMIFSKEHQALHDYMAKTRVLRTGKLQGPRLAAITLCLLLSVVIGGYHFTHPKTASSPVPSNQSQNASLDPIISRIPAVVTLYTYDTRGKAVAQGSGFLITSNGVAVTNFHVLNGSYSANAKLGDGRLYNVVKIQAYDADRDIAIFQLGRKAIPPCLSSRPCALGEDTRASASQCAKIFRMLYVATLPQGRFWIVRIAVTCSALNFVLLDSQCRPREGCKSPSIEPDAS